MFSVSDGKVELWATSWDVLVPKMTTADFGMTLIRKQWILLNRFRKGVGMYEYWRVCPTSLVIMEFR